MLVRSSLMPPFSTVGTSSARAGIIVPSAVTDWTSRDTCVLFGDGAGAVVLQASARPGPAFQPARRGRHPGGISVHPGRRLPDAGFGGNHPQPQALHPYGGARDVQDAVNTMLGAAQEAIARAGLTVADIDLMVPHQANMRIVEAVAKRLGEGVIDKVFLNWTAMAIRRRRRFPWRCRKPWRPAKSKRRQGPHGGFRRRAVMGRYRGGVAMSCLLLFPGQGAQAVGMGRELAEGLDECRALFSRASDVLGFDLLKLCLEGPIVLETLKGRELAFVHDDIVADQPHIARHAEPCRR